MTADLTPRQKGDERLNQAGRGHPFDIADEAWAAEYTGHELHLNTGVHMDLTRFEWPMSGDALALTKAGIIA